MYYKHSGNYSAIVETNFFIRMFNLLGKLLNELD